MTESVRETVNSPCVLDASAVLALLNRETGAGIVEEALVSGAVISSVNLSEVVAKLIDVGLSPAETGWIISGLGLRIESFGSRQAYEAGILRLSTKELGLSLGDRACMALAVTLGFPVLTADRSWVEVDLPVEIRVIR